MERHLLRSKELLAALRTPQQAQPEWWREGISVASLACGSKTTSLVLQGMLRDGRNEDVLKPLLQDRVDLRHVHKYNRVSDKSALTATYQTSFKTGSAALQPYSHNEFSRCRPFLFFIFLARTCPTPWRACSSRSMGTTFSWPS